MIKDDKIVAEEQDHVGHIQLALCGYGETLHEAHQIIAEVSDGAAGKAGQSGNRHRRAVGQKLLNDLERITLARFEYRTACAADDGLLTHGDGRHGWMHTQETVAADLLTSFDRFEEETGPLMIR